MNALAGLGNMVRIVTYLFAEPFRRLHFEAVMAGAVRVGLSGSDVLKKESNYKNAQAQRGSF